jgi:tetratricopeptide (TPR) repeat protein
MKLTKLAFGAGVAVVIAVGSLLGGAFRASGQAAAGSAPPIASERLSTGFAAGDTASLVQRLQLDVRARPEDGRSLALLGLAYQQRARETGDPSYYARSEAALRRALHRDRIDLLAVGGLGSLALSRHRFEDALALGRRAQRLSPSTARTYGVIGDALVELGRYHEAFRNFDTMSRLKPSLSSYARVSYGRELLGRQAGAVAAMRLAVEASAGQGEPEAWTRVQLGKLHWAHGELGAAERQYRAALRVFPGYASALDALAQVEAADGNLQTAIALERRAVDAVPLPQSVAFLGDLYRTSGKPVLASRQYALIGAIDHLLRANGVRTDLEIALFQVDHGIRLGEALRRARAAQTVRPSIDGDDVLAWALARNGRCSEALAWSKRALRLGTLDAGKYFHRAEIERCLGRDDDARTWYRRALALNPHFSLLFSPKAKAALR